MRDARRAGTGHAVKATANRRAATACFEGGADPAACGTVQRWAVMKRKRWVNYDYCPRRLMGGK